MGEELTEYQERRLEVEEAKLEELRQLRKDLKKRARMEGVHRIIDELDVDKQDVESIAGFLRKKFAGGDVEQEELKSRTIEDVSDTIAEAVRSATSDDVDVTVEVEEED
jgi:translation initiation factor 1 (eIF-1/SUI1)